jgi:EAL domain-containing protein (putative c-di-GMP-specific phosphodiesterase class I)
VALDDLGSDYGSLNLLASLRPDFVKLDIGLAQGLGRDPYRAAISRKLIELADELGVAVIVEGIETEEQWRWLAAHGADYAQGYFFAKPASPPPIPAQVYAWPRSHPTPPGAEPDNP